MSVMQLCTCHSTNRVVYIVYIRINSEALSVPEKFACFVVEATTLWYFQLVQLYQVTSGSFSAIEKHVYFQHGDTPFCFLFQSWWLVRAGPFGHSQRSTYVLKFLTSTVSELHRVEAPEWNVLNYIDVVIFARYYVFVASRIGVVTMRMVWQVWEQMGRFAGLPAQRLSHYDRKTGHSSAWMGVFEFIPTISVLIFCFSLKLGIGTKSRDQEKRFRQLQS